ncbi:hypothetical protein [Streptacidiphilus fuscans]|uniref:Low molecular weight antigen MTB12-like C-terminal domain-containing protein n=1 Tax=Streptacidiphilus fuscans TaxID=2789292 RepID=A0A931FGB9_9ACTN|nr:hypothetical protein [Streptacidiphilus fuscans]MBF9071135.1 hypothetical protein [Streptacidiphilus fuscans]
MGRTRTVLFRAGTAAAVLLLAAACSSSGGSSSGSPSASATSGAASGAPASSAPANPSGSAAAAACGSSVPYTVSGSGPADVKTAAQQVAANYNKFFDPATSDVAKVALLQNGVKFTPVLLAFGKDPQAAQTTVGVTKVDFTGATTAKVTYNVCLSGAEALPNSTGQSVNENGIWKVADTTLCGLLQLKAGSTPIPGCS